MSAFDPKRTSGPSFYALSAACGFHCDLRMRVTVIRSNMPAFVKGSPAEKDFSLRTRLHVDDEQATSCCRVVVCQRPRERELTFVVQGSRGATNVLVGEWGGIGFVNAVNGLQHCALQP